LGKSGAGGKGEGLGSGGWTGKDAESGEVGRLSQNSKDIRRYRNFYFMYTHKRGKFINEHNKKCKTARD
jgi:hypothetical protein